MALLLGTGAFLAVSVLATRGGYESARDRSAGEISSLSEAGLEDLAASVRDSHDSSVQTYTDLPRLWARNPEVVRTAIQAGNLDLQTAFDKWSDPSTRKFVAGEAAGDGDPANDLNPDLSRYFGTLERVKGLPLYPEIFFTDSRGWTVAANVATGDFDQGPDDWRLVQEVNGTAVFKKVDPRAGGEEWYDRGNTQPGGVYVSDITLDESTGVWGLEVIVNITDPSSRRVGTMKVVFDYSTFVRFSVMPVLEQDLVLRVTSKTGQVIVSNSPIYTGREDVWVEEGVAIALTGSDPQGVYRGALKDGQRYITAFARSLLPSKYIVLISMPERQVAGITEQLSSSLDRSLSQQILYLAAGVAVVLALAVGLSAWVSSTITKPISHLTEVAEQVRKGNLEVEVRTSGKDEIAALGTAMRQMIASIRLLAADEPPAGQDKAETKGD